MADLSRNLRGGNPLWERVPHDVHPDFNEHEQISSQFIASATKCSEIEKKFLKMIEHFRSITKVLANDKDKDEAIAKSLISGVALSVHPVKKYNIPYVYTGPSDVLKPCN